MADNLRCLCMARWSFQIRLGSSENTASFSFISLTSLIFQLFRIIGCSSHGTLSSVSGYTFVSILFWIWDASFIERWMCCGGDGCWHRWDNLMIHWCVWKKWACSVNVDNSDMILISPQWILYFVDILSIWCRITGQHKANQKNLSLYICCSWIIHIDELLNDWTSFSFLGLVFFMLDFFRFLGSHIDMKTIFQKAHQHNK